LVHRGATEVQDRRGEELTGDFRRCAHLAKVVQHTHHEDHAGREQHTEHLVRGEDDVAKCRDGHGDQERDAKADQHRRTPAVGRGDLVDLPFVGQRRVADAQRNLPRRHVRHQGHDRATAMTAT